MKSLLILALLAQPVPNADRVQIVQETSSANILGLAKGSGYGNLTDPSGTYGFQFVYSGCRGRFTANPEGSFYKGRLEGMHDITVVASVTGSDRETECHLKVTMKDARYGRVNGQLVTLPPIKHPVHAELR